MKITLKKKKGHFVAKSDKNRSQSVFRKLTRLSIQKSRPEPDKRGDKPLKRAKARPVEASADPSGVGELEVVSPGGLNKSGNRTGMHNAENPPESDHMRRIRGMRRMYNKMMPVLSCANCSFASSCPQFKSGYECAFLPFLNAHKVETTDDLLHYMKDLVASNARRAHLATIMETLSGSTPSLELSESLMMLFAQMKELHEVLNEGEETSLTIEGDESIIGKLFGGIGNLLGDTERALNEPIDVHRIALNGEGRSDSGMGGGGNVNEEVMNAFAKSELARNGRPGNTPQVVLGTLSKI